MIFTHRDPPFKVKASILPVAEYLIRDCIKYYPAAKCSICEEQAFPEDPAHVTYYFLFNA